MPYKDPKKALEKRLEYDRKNYSKRKIYERERKNKKRLEMYDGLPEPERTRRLEANARRRSYMMRWSQV